MKTFDALARVRAWHAGRPLARGSTLPLRRAVAEDRLLVAFLTMGGETAPWGVVWGRPGETPRVATTPEPRNRDAVGAMLAPFAEALLEHLPHPLFAGHDAAERVLDQACRRQLWLPGESHLDVLHLLHYRLASARSPEQHLELLRALGRASGYLFRESCRPGQQRVIDASALLRSVYDFPADDAHLSHLGFALAWLETPGARAARVAAASVAEDESIGTTLHPDFEREHIAPDLDAFVRLERSCPEARRLAASICGYLEAELLRRYRALERAVAWVDADPRPTTPSIESLDAQAGYLFGQHWNDECARLRGEQGREVNAETDGHVLAAFGYLGQQRGQDDFVQVLLHGDAERLEEALLGGDAVRGTLMRVLRTGQGNCRRTRWWLDAPADVPLRLREGEGVCPVGVPKMEIIVRGIRLEAERRLVELEVTGQYKSGLTTGFPAADDVAALTGREVTLVPRSMAGLLMGKAKRLKHRQGPGGWLTEPEPVPPVARPRAPSEDVLALVEGLRD